MKIVCARKRGSESGCGCWAGDCVRLMRDRLGPGVGSANLGFEGRGSELSGGEWDCVELWCDPRSFDERRQTALRD